MDNHIEQYQENTLDAVTAHKIILALPFQCMVMHCRDRIKLSIYFPKSIGHLKVLIEFN